MGEETLLHWGMNEMPPLEGAPFVLARSSCRHAVQVARDVAIDEAALQRFSAQLDVRAVQDILHGTMGENCDTVSDEFRHGQDAVNFALLFSLLQFGYGFRYELHRLCRRGASQTITLGVRTLHGTGDLGAARLRRLAAPHDQRYDLSQDAHQAIAPVDNVIPAMLVYQGILRLSPTLHQIIHQQRVPLARGPQEAELRAVALASCEQIVAATGDTFTALDLGYYLWRSGKEAGARQFARHHTQDTVFY